MAKMLGPLNFITVKRLGVWKTQMNGSAITEYTDMESCLLLVAFNSVVSLLFGRLVERTKDAAPYHIDTLFLKPRLPE